MKDWEIKDTRVLLETRIWTVQETDKVTPDGKEIKTVSLKSPNWCTAVIKNTDTNKFVMIREFRHGINKWVYEFPSGTVEEGEDVEATVLREVTEETGYKNPKIVKRLSKGNPNPAFMNNSTTSFYIEVSGKPEGQSLDADETINLHEIDNPEDYLNDESSVIGQLAWAKYKELFR